MRTKLLLSVLAGSLAVAFAVYLAPEMGLTGAAPPKPLQVASVAPVEPATCSDGTILEDGSLDVVPASHNCGDCAGSFCPQSGVRCDFVDCGHGKNGCCEYECSCDSSCCTVTNPPHCDLGTLPNCGNCCRQIICQIKFCQSEGFACVANGFCNGQQCCFYTCGVPDGSCTAPDPCPGNACNCS